VKEQQNYPEEFEKWVSFVRMSPTEQIKKCMHDLSIEDLTERSFLKKKFREYKALLENEGNLHH
jgi:hypothetical protein